MLNWSFKKQSAVILALFAVYFPIALYLRDSYIPEQAPPGTVAELNRPFFKFSNGSFDYLKAMPSLDQRGDSNDDPYRSPFLIYEDDRPLGPSHNSTADVAELGQGLFAHWKEVGFIFSSSDGTNPQSNGRKYRVVLPPENSAPAPAGAVTELRRPFSKFLPGGFDFVAAAPVLKELADSPDDGQRSPFVIYENDRPLGPAHSEVEKIHELGHGRFLHWKDIGFIISSSDGKDPRTSGRRYWVVRPPENSSPPPAGMVAELKGLFKFMAGGFDYATTAPELNDLADSLDGLQRSPFVVYEDDRPLGPAHSAAADIHDLGHGRFSHWKDIGFIISSSDGTDPFTNGRKYWVVKPP